MNEPWFDPNMYAWIPGTLLGVMGGLLGGLSGTLAPRGKAKALVLGVWWLMTAVSAILVVVAVIAFFSSQPYGIWYGLGLPGVIGLLLFPSLLPVIKLRYRQAEQRKMMAADLTEESHRTGT